MVKPEMFTVVVDYSDLERHSSDKCQLHLRAFPNIVRGARVEMATVDYLIEQQ